MFERADTEGDFYLKFEDLYMILAKRLFLHNFLNIIFKKII